MNRPQRSAVVVVNYGSHALLERNFSRLDFNALGARVYVVDNYHDTHERDAITRACARQRWTLVANKANTGFGDGVNIGVTRALDDGARSLLIVNPDVTLTTEVAAELLRATADGITAVCPRINDPTGRPGFVGGSLDLKSGMVRTSQPVNMAMRTSWLSGACIALSDSLWRSTGGFDPTYFMYWEDVDFSQRCRNVGATLLVREDLTVIHAVGGTQGHRKSALYTYFNCRNRLLYAARWLTPSQQWQWVRRTPSCSYEILLRGQGRRGLVNLPRLAAAIRGSVAGLIIVRSANRGKR